MSHGPVSGDKGPFRILYAGSGEPSGSLVRRYLDGDAPRFVVETVEDRETCLGRLLAEPFDALLLDQRRPTRSPMEILREVRALGVTIPIVVMTRRGAERGGVGTVRPGANDYLVVPSEALVTLAATLESAIAAHRAREERQSLEILNGGLKAINESLDLSLVLQRTLQASRRLLRTERNLILLRENGDALVPRAWDGFDPRAFEGTRFSASAGAFGRALAARGPVRLERSEAPALEIAKLRSGLLVPVAVGERVLGVLLVASVAVRPFSKTDERLLRALADHAAAAIDHAQRYQDAMNRGERLATLLDFTQRVAAHRPYDDLLPLIADEARRLLGATAAAFRLVEGDELAIAVCAGPSEAITGPTRLKIGEGLCGRVAASGRPLRIADAREESLEHRPEYVGLVSLGIRSYLGVPLLVRERVTGVLAVYGADPDRFSKDDVALLLGFAGQAAVAVENARLIQQLLHAERLSAVGRIVAGVAHELNNPLAVVIGTADLLRREEVDGRMAERLQRISGQAQRAIKIVRSLLTLARKKPAQRIEVDLNQLLDETLDLEAYELRSAHVAVVRKLSPDLPKILGDPDQLQQVFTNLFLNASEAMRETHGGGTLTVGTRYDGQTDGIVVTVTDDGPGIQPGDRHRIFEPFFTTKGEGKGTGLGLAICRQIVDSHRGRITLESQPGAGATFTVALPVSPAVEQRPVEPPRELRTAARSANVLLVEDEGVVGDLLAEFLALDGHHVDRAANGREALELVKRRRYGLIVSDVRMPDVDGPSLYRELRGINPDLTHRMVFVTGDVMSPETRQFLEYTGLSYLEKPFGIAEFHAVVQEVLGHGAPQAARPAQTA